MYLNENSIRLLFLPRTTVSIEVRKTYTFTNVLFGRDKCTFTGKEYTFSNSSLGLSPVSKYVEIKYSCIASISAMQLLRCNYSKYIIYRMQFSLYDTKIKNR